MVEQQTQQKPKTENHEDRIVRILSRDIEGKSKVLAGLTQIKGISWAFANAVCKVLKIQRDKKIGALTEAEIKSLSEFVKNPKLPAFVLNRRLDFETGENKHLVGTDLELRNEFDIKRLKKIKSYRGVRHASNLPVRGQRTRSNFRRNRKRGVGIKKKGKKTEGGNQE